MVRVWAKGMEAESETGTERERGEQRRGSCQTARPRRFASDALAIRESRAELNASQARGLGKPALKWGI